MMSLLDECVVISSKSELLELCTKYRVIEKSKESNRLHDDGLEQRAYIVSEEGLRECDADCPKGLTVFKTLNALKLYLFKKALLSGKIVVYKRTYRCYLKAIRLLKKLGIKTIKDRTYFEEAHCFYVSCGKFKELDSFGCKVIVSMTKGIQFNCEELVSALKMLIKEKNRHVNYVANAG